MTSLNNSPLLPSLFLFFFSYLVEICKPQLHLDLKLELTYYLSFSIADYR